MGVYDPLYEKLKGSGASRVTMTFAEIGEVLGRNLPASAYLHRPWWANEARGHSHAKAWLDAGYETSEVDMAGKRLTFKRIGIGAMAESGKEFEQAQASEKNPRRHPAFGALKGTFTIEPGYDLTSPMYTPEEWAEVEKEMAADWDVIEQGTTDKSK
ncbi:MAG TPA: hypothetical protein VGG10_19175 [Rhizomicrobium sp.]|jgi:hypothetical protein